MINSGELHYFEMERLVLHEEQESYYLEIPFEMPEHTEELRVETIIEPLGDGHCVIDLGLRSPTRVIGWSGGARTSFNVGLMQATPGYLPGELIAGQWAVLLGAYRVPPAGCNVRVRIQCKPKAYRWLKGDLHSHTVHSDGVYTLLEAAKIMETLDCDFLATTDHNTSSQNNLHPQETELLFIPGYEFTTNRGHANFLGVTDPIKDFRSAKAADIHDRILEARNKGATIVLNHIHCDRLPWEWGFDAYYNCIEVWNGVWAERNQRALDWWQEQLCSGKRIAVVGGSDTHRPQLVKHAEPTTWVYAYTRTVDGILDGIKKGHAFISCSPKGPTIEMTLGSSMMGDVHVIESGLSEQAEATFQQLEIGDILKIVSECGVEEEHVSGVKGSLSHVWTIADRLFYRVEAWRFSADKNKTLLAALSNPIYISNLAEA